MGVETAILVAGTAISVYGQIGAAEEQANSAKQQGAIKDIEARETLERAKMNEVEILRESENFQTRQFSGFAAGNVDITTGTPLMVMESTSAFFRREIETVNREANFRAQQTKYEADSYRSSAESTKRAAMIGAIGGSLITAGSAYANSGSKNPKTEKSVFDGGTPNTIGDLPPGMPIKRQKYSNYA